MKRFLMFSASVLCLALAALIAFYIGSYQVEAQGQPDAIYLYQEYAEYHNIIAILPNGDVYGRTGHGWRLSDVSWNNAPNFLGNFWDGVVSTEKHSWSGVKDQFDTKK